MDYEKIVRDLLRARVCVEGVAKDTDEAYRILAHDLGWLVVREAVRMRDEIFDG